MISYLDVSIVIMIYSVKLVVGLWIRYNILRSDRFDRIHITYFLLQRDANLRVHLATSFFEKKTSDTI